MTTDRKIAANRHNAARSTGPRSPGGRARSSRNSLLHGFSAVYSTDGALSEEAERLARLLVDNDASPHRLVHARIAAEAQITILRVRAARVTFLNLASADPTKTAFEWSILTRNLPKELGPQSSAPDPADPDRIGFAYRYCLPALVKLDRYERAAFARRKRALRAMSRHSS